jgi:pyridinium-3,5-biscarboxylic acid mononucleotide sulfurtransferase
MFDELAKKYLALRSSVKNIGSVVVAFSGGADSSLLAWVSRDVLGKENVLAVTAASETFPEGELDEARDFALRYDIEHKVIRTDELATINNAGNPVNRCYYCKKELFGSLCALRDSIGFAHVIEGSNTDDAHDYRPGRKALGELGIVSPLKDAGLSKSDIRAISNELGLPTWNKPAYACLTSRFPYNITIDERSLKMIERSEIFLRSLGFLQCRVRCFGEKAVIEVEKEMVERALSLKSEIDRELLEAGWREVEIDPLGYRMGRMNSFVSKENQAG